MAVIAADVLVDRRDGASTVFFDVKCSMALEAILASGGVHGAYRTLVHRELRSNQKAVMAGEMSATSSSMEWLDWCSLYNAARLRKLGRTLTQGWWDEFLTEIC